MQKIELRKVRIRDWNCTSVVQLFFRVIYDRCSCDLNTVKLKIE